MELWFRELGYLGFGIARGFMDLGYSGLGIGWGGALWFWSIQHEKKVIPTSNSLNIIASCWADAAITFETNFQFESNFASERNIYLYFCFLLQIHRFDKCVQTNLDIRNVQICTKWLFNHTPLPPLPPLDEISRTSTHTYHAHVLRTSSNGIFIDCF